MPKRKLLKTSEETLRALKVAHGNRRVLTASEENEHEKFRKRSSIKKIDSDVYVTAQKGRGVFRKGEKRWRRGSEEHPLTIESKKRERDFLSEAAKIRRRPPVQAASAARTKKSRRPEVERLLRKYGLQNRNAGARISKALGVSVSYVLQVRKKMQLTESHHSES